MPVETLPALVISSLSLVGKPKLVISTSEETGDTKPVMARAT